MINKILIYERIIVNIKLATIKIHIFPSKKFKSFNYNSMIFFNHRLIFYFKKYICLKISNKSMRVCVCV